MVHNLEELRQAHARAKAAAESDPAAAQARASYLASLPQLYDAESAAGLKVPLAPGDPAAPKNTGASGMRAKVVARIVSVKKTKGGTEVCFARGSDADPELWTNETVGVVEGEVVLAPGTVVTLDAAFTPGQSPAWRIHGATLRE